MKFSSIFAALALATTAFSIPLAANNGNSLQQRETALTEGFSAGLTHSFEERGRTKKVTHKTKPKVTHKKPKPGHTTVSKPRKAPRYKSLPSKPAKGISGVHYDPTDRVTHVYFGDDLKTHGAHIAHHDAQYPAHKGKVYNLAKGSRKATGTEWHQNAGEALNSLKTTPRKTDANGKRIEDFDEKPWASLSRENDHKVSVVRVPRDESAREGNLAKRARNIHVHNPNSKGIMIHDHRSNPQPLDPKLILKKRSILDDMRNRTDSIIGDIANATSQFVSEIESDWASFRSKMEDVIEPMLSNVSWVGDNFAGFLKQDTSPEDHQLGVFWHGMTSMDDVINGYMNSTDEDDRNYVANATNLAMEYAAMMLHYETAAHCQNALIPFLDAIGEWKTDYSNPPDNSTITDDGSDSDESDSDDDSDDSDDDSDDESDTPSNSTAAATSGMIPVNMDIVPTGTFASYATNAPSNATAAISRGANQPSTTGAAVTTAPYQGSNGTTVGSSQPTAVPVDTTCTEEEAKATTPAAAVTSVAGVASVASVPGYASSVQVSSQAVASSETTPAAVSVPAATSAASFGYGRR